MKTAVVLNDIQYPWHDAPVMDLVVDFVCDLKPDKILLNGDVTDCYTLSSFDKNPLNKHGLDTEIRLVGKLLARLSKVTKELIWIGGNHEDRARRIIWKQAPALGVVPNVQFQNLFNLQHYGCQWKEYGDGEWLGKMWVTHGSIVRKDSAATAKAHFNKYGVSTMIGHTQRMGAYYHRNRTGVHVAYENGCLCRLDPEYDAFPDWQQGLSVVHVDGQYFNTQQMHILNRSHFYYGKDRIGKPVKSR